MSPSIVRALRRSILAPAFNRAETVARLASLDAQHSESARRRDDALRVAEQDEALWRAPARRLLAERAAAAREAAAETRERNALAAQLHATPPRCLSELREHVRAIYSHVNRSDDRGPGLRAVGEALVHATVFIRDECWKLDDETARRECETLRRAIDEAVTALRRPADDEDES